MKLPSPIAAYFEAEGQEDGAALVASFAEDAIVSDEAASHEGHEAIVRWWASAKEKYHQTTEPLVHSNDGEGIVVRCRVSGDFPNSPVQLDFRFTLVGDKIARLDIH